VESRFVTNLPWDSSTDRDIDFHRTYNRKYYDYAIEMINYEVRYFKALQKPVANLFRLPVLKLRSTWAKGKMWMEERKPLHNHAV
jgi:hypothetical protein